MAPSEVGTYIPLISGFKRFKDPVTQQETPDKYEFEWQGPWTFPMLTGTVIEEAPLPFGNYTIKVRGKKTAASPELVSAVYTKVSLVAVTTVQLQTHVSPLDVNPNAGDGKRIFPEATQPAPNDDIGNRDMVRVVATTSPAVTDPGPSPQLPVSVFFRAIDVDDPSAAGDDVDKEESLKDNRADGEAGVGLTDVGQPGDVTAVGSTRPITVGAAGGATAYFRVSKRQGDNYRVAASMDQAEIASFVPRNASLVGEVLTATGTPVTKNITEMLTVWRTLHLEMDYIDSSEVAQTAAEAASDASEVLDVTGNNTNIMRRRLEDSRDPFVVKGPKGGQAPRDHSRNHGWVGGDLWPRYSPLSPGIAVNKPHKNLPRLIEAFARLRATPGHEDVHLMIIGDEIGKTPELRRRVESFRLRPFVRFFGFVPETTLAALYRLATVFVFPSQYEGFGLPPLEAMACGTPVVTSNVSSLPEVVGDAAVLVDPHDGEAIAAGLSRILDDPAFANELREKGRIQAKKFNWEDSARKTLAGYQEALGQ